MEPSNNHNCVPGAKIDGTIGAADRGRDTEQKLTLPSCSWANGCFTNANAEELSHFLNQEPGAIDKLVGWHGAAAVQKRLSVDVLWNYLIENGAELEVSSGKIGALADLLRRAAFSEAAICERLLAIHETNGFELEESAVQALWHHVSMNEVGADAVVTNGDFPPEILDWMGFDSLTEIAGYAARNLDSRYLRSPGKWNHFALEIDSRLASRVHRTDMSMEEIGNLMQLMERGHQQFAGTLQVLGGKVMDETDPIGIDRLSKLAELQIDGNVYQKEIFQRICKELPGEADTLSPLVRWQLLYAFASANRFSPVLTRVLKDALNDPLPEDRRWLGRAIWTVSALVACTGEAERFSDFFDRAALALENRTPKTSFATRRLYHLALLLDKPLSENLMNVVANWERRAQNHLPCPRGAELALALAFSQWDIPMRKGQVLFACTPDLIIELNGAPWVVECDGPSCHFVGGERQNGLRGSDMVRDKVFQKQGYGVLRVSSNLEIETLHSLLMKLKDAPVPKETVFHPALRPPVEA